jgi:hypothetical protein
MAAFDEGGAVKRDWPEEKRACARRQFRDGGDRRSNRTGDDQAARRDDALEAATRAVATSNDN